MNKDYKSNQSSFVIISWFVNRFPCPEITGVTVLADKRLCSPALYIVPFPGLRVVDLDAILIRVAVRFAPLPILRSECSVVRPLPIAFSAGVSQPDPVGAAVTEQVGKGGLCLMSLWSGEFLAITSASAPCSKPCHRPVEVVVRTGLGVRERARRPHGWRPVGRSGSVVAPAGSVSTTDPSSTAAVFPKTWSTSSPTPSSSSVHGR